MHTGVADNVDLGSLCMHFLFQTAAGLCWMLCASCQGSPPSRRRRRKSAQSSSSFSSWSL